MDLLAPGPLRELYAVFCQLVAENIHPEFDRVLTYLEQPELKNLLVDLDQQVQHKAPLAADDPESRLVSLIESFQCIQEEKERRIKKTVLDDTDASDDVKLDLLQQLFERKKNRLGTTVPTEG